MRKRRSGVWIIMVALPLLLSACGDQMSDTEKPPPAERPSESEKLLMDYIRREQSGEHGVYANRLETNQGGEAASGHDVLSESSGILLRYYAARQDRKLFDQLLEQTKRVFDGETGFSYRYSPKADKRYDVNATVDDLRIIRALYEGAEAFEQSALRKEAEQYGERLLDHNAMDGKLYDFYDEKLKKTNGFLTLCYADLGTLRLMAKDSREAAELSDRLLAIVHGGYLSDRFPFYETRYVYSSGQYESERINMVEALLTVLSLAEVGEERDESIDVIKQMVKAGELYGTYDRNGNPQTDIRSTALYAIAAMIGSETGDEELHGDAIERMTEFQIMDTDSDLYGGFGDTVTGQAYSFDNLMALLALAYKSE